MTQLQLLLGLGMAALLAFGLALFVRALATGAGRGAPRSHAELSEFLQLPGLSFPNPTLLLSRTDYEFLRSAPALAPVAAQLLRDRRQLVRVWLKLLARDTLTLWRFRRVLVQHGAASSLAEELCTTATAAYLLMSFTLLRAGVALLGPFALVDFLRAAPRFLDSIQSACARVLVSLPQSNLGQVRAACCTPD
jgi:hypothetical protein